MVDKSLPVNLSTLLAKLAETSDEFILSATEAVVAKELRSWSPVLLPIIAASFVFSAVVKSLVDNSFPVTLSTLLAKLVDTSKVFAFAFILADKPAVSVAFNFKFRAIVVAAEIGLSKSAVLFILSKAKLDFKLAKLLTPVPPDVIGIIPLIFSASTVLANWA